MYSSLKLEKMIPYFSEIVNRSGAFGLFVDIFGFLIYNIKSASEKRKEESLMKEYRMIRLSEDKAQLKKMTDDETALLCNEIRDFLCESVTETGGHLASNLGVVELTVAIHKAFDLPKIISYSMSVTKATLTSC